jgi:poly(hydroxyalkanoate) granule-associated protein
MDVKDYADVPGDLAGAARKIWFAGLGAVALAQQEGGKLLASLVSVGEQVEKDMKSAVGSQVDSIGNAAADVEGVWRKMQSGFDAQVGSALRRLGVPTRDEIAELGRRVDALTASIDALKPRR